jgi:acyl dehydratase
VPDKYFEEHAVGDTWRSHGRTITEADIVNFAGVSGDFHPSSMDERFAVASRFGRRIAHGALTFSATLGLAWQTKMNTKNFTYGIDRLRFIRPVFAGDSIYVVGTVTEVGDYEKRPDVGFVVMRYDTYNQDDELVFTCIHRMLVARSEADVAAGEMVSR